MGKSGRIITAFMCKGMVVCLTLDKLYVAARYMVDLYLGIVWHSVSLSQVVVTIKQASVLLYYSKCL